MSLIRKGAFDAHPALARRVATKRSLARWVLFCERLAPLLLAPATVLALFLAAAWFGLFRQLPDLGRWVAFGLFVFAFLTTILPLGRLRWPSATDADHLLEERNHLPHQPVSVQEEEPAFDNPVARALWKEHQLRMARRIAALDAGLPQPDIARHDRFALRAVPALLLAAAFGYSYSNGGGSVSDILRPSAPALSVNPDLRIDAWLTPPGYTGRPPIFLTGREAPVADTVKVAQFAELTVRVTGGQGGESVTFAPLEGGPEQMLPQDETAGDKARTAAAPAGAPPVERTASASAPPRTYKMKINESGDLTVNGQQWMFDVVPDRAPEIAFDKQPRRAVNGALEIGFLGKDDYGVQKAFALIEPAEAPAAGAQPLYPLPEYKLDIPRQNARDIKGTSSRNLTEHPLSGKRVRITLVAVDGAGQEGRSPAIEMVLPARRFVEPLAAAIAEQRQVFALDVRQMPKAIALNEALAIRPEETIPKLSHYLLIRSAQERMRLSRNEEQLKDTADYLWQIALGIEDGDLSLAERRLRDAQQALSEALENNASDEEIAKLMQELREAMQNFMSELAERMQNMPQGQQNMEAQNVIRQRDLQNMMDQIENLARSGNKDAAQQMLSELQRMMNNLQAGRMQRPQQGQQQASPMRQQIDKLGELMQEQQRLMDQTFQLNQALRDRMQRGDPNQPYDQGQQQQGQQGQQQQGQQQQGQQQQGQQGQQGQNPSDQMTAEQLREALKNLRAQQEGLGKKLQELQQGLKELGMDPGPGFGEAGREMGNAGEALGEGQGDQAVEGQGNALNALRQGAQSMMQQMMQAMQGQGQGQGQQPGPGQGLASQGGQNGRDPLGRPRATTGPEFGDQVKVPDEIDVQRAREILDAIRNRLGNSLSGEAERRYLERLLDIR
ncbi:TIGR02302 family protein [Rhizobium sp. SSA_523]|uniref:TIGR02302 family protein n=1 Tax=Rhizobium sp. SSA_523 TaxID=2952477 RepID=UPI002090D226|nr:TIGR02302 family protein [Rhizobium sp. SSA_523]MCO5733676.1 TIGR02302 family protein [Rhizobium sp. SSA_523]WKC23032.1 TIGR02302 family protein [Rhizobium sp. SSA_523]